VTGIQDFSQFIEAKVGIDTDSILRKRQKFGRFVLATNKMDLEGEIIVLIVDYR